MSPELEEEETAEEVNEDADFDAAEPSPDDLKENDADTDVNLNEEEIASLEEISDEEKIGDEDLYSDVTDY